MVGVRPVNGDQPLHVKRRPANEKGNHHGNCNRITLIVFNLQARLFEQTSSTPSDSVVSVLPRLFTFEFVSIVFRSTFVPVRRSFRIFFSRNRGQTPLSSKIVIIEVAEMLLSRGRTSKNMKRAATLTLKPASSNFFPRDENSSDYSLQMYSKREVYKF